MSKTAKKSILLSFITIISRIFGLIRDHFQAIFFGTGPVAFAWEIATLIPGMLRTLLVEGGISQAFIPIYSASLENSKKEASKTAGVVIIFVFGLMIIVTICALIISPFIFPLLTHKTPKESEFLIYLNSILILYLVPASLTSVLVGISNSHGFFGLPAILPIILNIGMIIGFITSNINNPQTVNATSQAWIWMGMAGVQFFIQYFYIWRKGDAPILSLNFKNPAIKKIFILMIPAILSNAVFQINQLFDVLIASIFIDPKLGAVPSIRFAQRLIQLPTGIIGVALSTAILPIISKQIANLKNSNNLKNFKTTENLKKSNNIKTNENLKNIKSAENIKNLKTAENLKKSNNLININTQTNEIQNEILSALQFALFLTIPASLGFFFLGEDIITLIFSGGKWDYQSTLMTWIALKYFILGIPLYSINKILVSVFFAYNDTKTPMKSMLVSTSINLILNLILVHFMAQGGIALSTSIAALAQTLQLSFILNYRNKVLNFTYLKSYFYKMLPIYLIMIIFLIFIKYFSNNISFYIGSKLLNYLKLYNLNEVDKLSYLIFPKVFIGVGGGLFIYFGLSNYFKIKEMNIIKDIFKK